MAKYNILDDQGNVVNTVVASPEFVEMHYSGRYAEVAEEVSAPEDDWRITTRAFLRRFTEDEDAALDLASIDDPTKSQEYRLQQAKLRRRRTEISLAAYIDLKDPDTIAGVTATMYFLNSIGVVQNPETRISEVLSIPPDDKERPQL